MQVCASYPSTFHLSLIILYHSFKKINMQANKCWAPSTRASPASWAPTEAASPTWSTQCCSFSGTRHPRLGKCSYFFCYSIFTDYSWNKPKLVILCRRLILTFSQDPRSCLSSSTTRPRTPTCRGAESPFTSRRSSTKEAKISRWFPTHSSACRGEWSCFCH